MKKHLFNLLLTLSAIGLIFSSCSNDNDYDSPAAKNDFQASLVWNKSKSMSRFSEILSKAAYEKKEVRDFLKSQALEKFDNGYNVFYSIVKNKKIDNTSSFKDVLISYANNEEELDNIEKAAPLLNIHLPEIANLRVSDIDTQDEEIPILYSNNLYLNGEIVDSLISGEIPAFALFVVDESGSVQKKQNSLRSSNPSLSINSEYEFTDPVFSPTHSQPNMLRASGTEALSKKYQKDGWVPKKDIDPELLKAYQNSTNNLRATRSMMYYGMSTPNQTPGTIRSDVKDCIFRFKIGGGAFERLESIATDKGNNPLFNGNSSHLEKGEQIKVIET